MPKNADEIGSRSTNILGMNLLMYAIEDPEADEGNIKVWKLELRKLYECRQNKHTKALSKSIKMSRLTILFIYTSTKRVRGYSQYTNSEPF